MQANDHINSLAILRAAPGSYLVLQPNEPVFTIVDATDSYLEATYTKREEIIGRALFDVFPDNPADKDATGVKNLCASLHYVVQHKTEHHMADQRYDVVNPEEGGFEFKVWRPFNKPVCNAAGEVQYIIHCIEDVTETMQLQKKVQEAEVESNYQRRLNNLFMQAPVAIAIFRGPGHIIELVNEAHLKIWGRTAAQVIGKPLFEAIPEAAGQGYEELLAGVLTTGEPYYARELHADLLRNGVTERVYFNFVYEPLKELDGTITGVMVVATEITEQVVARKKIEKSEEELLIFKFMADHVADFIGMCDMEGIPFYVNASGRKLVGIPEGADVSKIKVADFFFPEDQAFIMNDFFSRVQQEEAGAVEVRFRHFTTGEPIWMLYSVNLLRNAEGAPLGYSTISHDITGQKSFTEELNRQVTQRTVELEIKNKELKRSNDHLEEFAHAASHDLKEPIRKIHFFTNRLKLHLDETLKEDDRQVFDRIENASQRMKVLIDDLLAYSQATHHSHDMETVDLQQVIQNVLEELELEIQESKAVIEVGEMPLLKGYRRQLQQVFQNLVSNAIKYHRPNVPARVLIECTLVDASETNLPFDNDKPFYLIRVKDNGIGFAPSEKERIFQMFHRLHGNTEYSGTGVGLSIARKVAENHGGNIVAESEPGKGTTFKVYLPVVA